jgi:Holliday junction DNA helicase RuvA
VSALVNLGIGRSDAYAAVAAAQTRLGDGAGLPAVISAALKDLGR